MAVKVIVFDFDGTLIHSNHLKYNSFFKLFPQDKFHKRIIEQVLKETPEASRYSILESIIKKINTGGGITEKKRLNAQVKRLAEKYNALVISGIKRCRNRKKVRSVLKALHNSYKLYLSSVTPQSSLRNIVRYKKLDSFFYDVLGYPNEKASVLLKIMSRELISPEELMVVGDGESDRDSARKAGCRFFEVQEDTEFEDVIEFVKSSRSMRRY